MEQGRKSRNKPAHLWLTNVWQRWKNVQGEKTVSSVTGAGETGQLQKNEIRTSSHTIHKSKLKMY